MHLNGCIIIEEKLSVVPKTKKLRHISQLSLSVLEAGIEPALQRNWILNPARLPVPPLEQLKIGLQNYKIFSFNSQKITTFIL